MDRIEPPKRSSTYGGIPFWSTHGLFIVGLGKTLNVNQLSTSSF